MISKVSMTELLTFQSTTLYSFSLSVWDSGSNQRWTLIIECVCTKRYVWQGTCVCVKACVYVLKLFKRPWVSNSFSIRKHYQVEMVFATGPKKLKANPEKLLFISSKDEGREEAKFGGVKEQKERKNSDKKGLQAREPLFKRAEVGRVKHETGMIIFYYSCPG